MRTVDILLISGVPAAGKSHFGAWLERNHSYLHLDAEKEGWLAKYGLEGAWATCFATSKAEPLVSALKQLGRSVILDWGFPPRCLSIVKLLKSSGVVIWWFDADHDAARKAFIARGDVPVEALNVQMSEIKRNWSAIRATFDPNLILTLRSDDTRLSPESIHEVLFGAKEKPA